MSTLVIPRQNSNDDNKDDILKIIIPTIIEEGLAVVRGEMASGGDKVTLVLPSIVNKIKTPSNSGLEISSTGPDGTGEVNIKLKLDNIKVDIRGVVEEYELTKRKFVLSYTPIIDTLRMYISGLRYFRDVDFIFDQNVITINSDIELDGEPIFFEYLITGQV
jgi:hypothetical protein